MRVFSLSLALKFIALLSIAALVGCESADVDPEHIAASGSGGSSSEGGGSTGGGDSAGDAITPGNSDTSEIDKTAIGQTFTDSDGKTYTKIAVDPPTTTQTSVTKLKVAPIIGYTFTWTLSNTSLGTISSKTGNEVNYITKNNPTTGSAVQIVRATGKSEDSVILYRGVSKITHRAP